MFYKLEPQALILSFKVSANAQRTEFKKQRTQEFLEIRVQAVREKGRANEALIAYLSGILKIPQSHIEILSGSTTPHKRIRLKNNHPEQLLSIINELIVSQG